MVFCQNIIDGFIYFEYNTLCMVDSKIFEDSVFSLRKDKYVSHYFLKYDKIQAREYQVQLADQCLQESSVVALPTGTGKTIISLLCAAERLREFENSKILFLAPLKPLAKQQAESFKEFLDINNEKIKVFTGDVRPAKREQLWDDLDVVFATPQVIENDIIADRISLEDVSYTVFDECHRAKGDYSYTFIAEEYWNTSNNPLVTGLSASPGTNKETILSICRNLGATNLEVLSKEDETLQKYLHETTIEGEFIDLPSEIIEVKETITAKYKDCTKQLKEWDYLSTINPSYKQLLHGCRSSIQEDVNKDKSEAYKALSVHAEAIKLYELQEIIAKKGLSAVGEKIQSWKDEVESSSNSSKALSRLISDPKIKDIYDTAQSYSETHPKLKRLRVLLAETLMDGGNAIVFCEYLDSVHRVVEFLQDSNIDAEAFVGQEEMTQKEQETVLERFRQNDFSVLVATKVAEEGLDLPQVDKIIEYHPVQSGLRKVQRSGRTGRDSSGTVYILVNSDTMEEGLYYASKRNKSKMEDSLSQLKEMRTDILDELRENQDYLREHGVTIEKDSSDQPEQDTKQMELSDVSSGEDKSISTDPIEETTENTIIIDSREMNSSIGRKLHKTDSINVEMEQLDVGDYIVGPDCAVERKSITDFIDTLTGGDRSLFEQLKDLSMSYEKPILLLEGDKSELYSGRRVHKNAVNGAIMSLQLDFGITVMYTDSESDTVNWLQLIANREQDDSDSQVQAHGNKSTNTVSDQQEYIVSSFEGIGTKTAQNLLNHFGTIEKIMTAEADKLQQVDKVGPKTAEYIRDIVEESYE